MEEIVKGSIESTYGELFMAPTSMQIEALLSAVKMNPVSASEVEMHLAYLDNVTNLSIESLDQTIALVASRWDPFKTKIIDITKTYTSDGTFVCLCAVVDSSEMEALREQLIAQLVDTDIEVVDNPEIAFHIPLSTSELPEALDAKALINMEISFDELSAAVMDEVYSHILNSNTGIDAFYITNNSDDCDGYAILRASDDVLVSCHTSEVEAQAELDRLLDEEGEKQDENLVKLGAKMNTELEDVVEEQVLESLGGQELEPESEEQLEVADTVTLSPIERGPVEQLGSMPKDLVEFEGVLVVEGARTGDRRYINPGALTWRDLPLPLMFTDARTEAHLGSRIAGVIVDIWRVEVDDVQVLMGRGFLDTGTVGAEASRMLMSGMIRGVSADLDNAKIAESVEDDEDPVLTLVEARIIGATLLPFPAFQEASIWVTYPKLEQPNDAPLVASGAELYSPQLSVLTKLSIGETQE